MRRVGKYAVGRTIGGGTFAKVKFAINTDTGGFVALKVLAKDTILRNKMVEQVYSATYYLVLTHFTSFFDQLFSSPYSLYLPIFHEIDLVSD